MAGNQCFLPGNYLSEVKRCWLPGDQCSLPGNYLPGGTTLNQVKFPSFLRSNLLNFFTCLSLISRNLSSLTLCINCWYLSMIEVDTKDASFDVLNSISLALSPRILLMDLTLA